MKFYLSMLFRTLRSRELNMLIASLILAIATMTSIGLFSNRIKNTIFEEASQFLGGDAKISGSHDLSPELNAHLKKTKLSISKQISFRAMAFTEKELRLTQVKSVDEFYPLKGSLRVKNDKGKTFKQKGPQKNTILINEALKNALNISIGDTIKIGEKPLIVSGIIIKEPDNVQSNFSFGPRAIMSNEDLDATEAIQAGSRINHSTLIAGNELDLQNFKSVAEPLLGEHLRWESAKDRRDRVGLTLNKAERFLLLAGALSLLLTGTAIALSAKQFSEQQRGQVALLKTLGSTKKIIFKLYTTMMLTVGLLGAAIGALIGWSLHMTLVFLLKDLLPAQLALAEFSAYIFAALSGLFSLIFFSCIPLFILQKTTPLSILRNQSLHNIPFRLSLCVGYLSILGLIWFLTNSLTMTLILSGGLLSLILCTYICILCSLKLMQGLASTFKTNKTFSLSLKNFRAHRSSHILQSLIFSIIFMLIAVLVEVRGGLLTRWQNQTPDNAANYFAFNIIPKDLPFFEKTFEQNDITHSPFYPMTRGRILSINGKPLHDLVDENRGRMNYERELNLTWSNELGLDNKIIEGQWWTEEQLKNQDKLYISAEEEYARGAGMKVGDTLLFSVGGLKVEAKLTNIRSVKWDSMNPNFFIMFDKQIGDGTLANWLTSFHLPEHNKDLPEQLTQSRPGVSLLALDQTITQIKDIIQKVSRGMEFILFLVLCSGVLVLTLSIKASVEERKKDTAIMLSMGAGQRLLQAILRCEFIILGVLSGLVASASAEISLYFVQTKLFDLGFDLHLWMWVTLPITATLLITIIGSLNTSRVTHAPPMQVLRET